MPRQVRRTATALAILTGYWEPISSGRMPPSAAALVKAMRFGETADQLAHDILYIHPALTEVVEQALLEIAPSAAQGPAPRVS